MENKEVLEKLKTDFVDEIKGYDHYVEMSKKAKEVYMDQGYHVLKDIAKEEFVHAKHLKNILCENDYWTQECDKMYEEAEMKYNEM